MVSLYGHLSCTKGQSAVFVVFGGIPLLSTVFVLFVFEFDSGTGCPGMAVLLVFVCDDEDELFVSLCGPIAKGSGADRLFGAEGDAVVSAGAEVV